MQQLLCIVGPTASGKTGLSIDLAKMLGGEVVSADSRQVYRGLDIGTEKVTKHEMRGVPHHCIDIASPRRAFSVEQWRNHAKRAISKIVCNDKLPIVAGGSGFYVDTLVYGAQFPTVKPNASLRRQLAQCTAPELLVKLERLDPIRAASIEQGNPRRLIRAIEIATALGHVPTLQKTVPRYDARWIGLNPGLPVLTERISARLAHTLRKGLVAETHRLRRDLGLSWKRIDELGLEYRIAAAHIRGEISRADMKEQMLRELRKYAKRQITWLKRNTAITWYPGPNEAIRDVHTKGAL